MKRYVFIVALLIYCFFITGCSIHNSKTDQLSSANNTPADLNGYNSTPDNHSQPAQKKDSGDIAQKVKDYILTGQKDKVEANKLKWSETFLNQVNIAAVYQNYLSTGGPADDVPSFAKYLTQHAPVLKNWQELAKDELTKTYGVTISKLDHLQDDLYQIYVNIDGQDKPYAVINARTGYFHG